VVARHLWSIIYSRSTSATYEPLALRLESWIVGAGLIGALATVLWLLVKGVSEQRWKERANAATASIWR
jgi:hypothetical protein